MKKKIMKKKIILTFGLLILGGCGLLGNKSVPKEQINTDLAGKTIAARSGSDPEIKTEWDFKDDSYRCFAPDDKSESKITESTADIPINISAIRLDKSGSEDTSVLFGEATLHYKKDNGKWTLQSLEPKDVRTNQITGDAFSKFVDLQMPLCNYFKYSKP